VSGIRRRYRPALRAVLSSESKAYGFALVVWGGGSMCVAQRGIPDTPQVLAFVAGSLFSMGVLLAASFGGPTAIWKLTTIPHRLVGAIHVLSVGAALGVAWLTATLISRGWLAFGVTALVSTAMFQLGVAFEVAATATE
jgi:hypothetical protein